MDPQVPLNGQQVKRNLTFRACGERVGVTCWRLFVESLNLLFSVDWTSVNRSSALTRSVNSADVIPSIRDDLSMTNAGFALNPITSARRLIELNWMFSRLFDLCTESVVMPHRTCSRLTESAERIPGGVGTGRELSIELATPSLCYPRGGLAPPFAGPSTRRGRCKHEPICPAAGRVSRGMWQCLRWLLFHCPSKKVGH